MDNWFVNKEEITQKTINAILGELEVLTEGKEDVIGNYWIDNTHNVFGMINDNGDDDKWIEIHYELYDHNGDIIGDLAVLSTDDVSKELLEVEIKTVVDMYFNN